MEYKTCFKCGRLLPITEFYTHPAMADGHLNKCKDCTKLDMHNQHIRNMADPERAEKERERSRDKYHRLYSGKKNKKMAHPETRNIREYFKRRGYDLAGKELHHWDYNQIHDVFILTRSEHARLHKQMTFDPDSKQFIYNGGLLTTRAAHEQAINQILSH